MLLDRPTILDVIDTTPVFSPNCGDSKKDWAGNISENLCLNFETVRSFSLYWLFQDSFNSVLGSILSLLAFLDSLKEKGNFFLFFLSIAGFEPSLSF